MIITSVQYKERYIRIILDSAEELRLPLESAGRFPLRVDGELSSGDYETLHSMSQRFRCQERALHFLSFRNRSTREMEQYLRKKSFDPDVIDATIERLKELNYIDDYNFALRYIEGKLRRKAVGPRLLRQELFQKGIASSLIDRAMEENEELLGDEEALIRLAEKKYRSLEGKEDRSLRLTRFLYQRGFEGNAVKRTVRRLEKGEDEEEFYLE